MSVLDYEWSVFVSEILRVWNLVNIMQIRGRSIALKTLGKERDCSQSECTDISL